MISRVSFFVLVQMQNEGSNGGHSCEQDLEKQVKSQEGLLVVGSGDEANQTLSTIVISNVVN